MCPLQSVFIDLDDTLFDHTHSVKAGLNTLRDQLPALRAIPCETLLANYNQWQDIYATQLMAGELTPEQANERRFERVLYSCGLPTAELDMSALVASYHAAYRTAEQAVPGAHAMLAAFAERQLPICVISNKPHPAQHARLDRLKLLHHIDDLITSEQAGSPKPDAAIFRHALAHMGVDAAEAVMIGDSWSRDVLGARRSGIRAVWLNRHHHPHPEPGRTPALTSLHPLDRVLKIVIAGHPN